MLLQGNDGWRYLCSPNRRLHFVHLSTLEIHSLRHLLASLLIRFPGFTFRAWSCNLRATIMPSQAMFSGHGKHRALRNLGKSNRVGEFN